MAKYLRAFRRIKPDKQMPSFDCEWRELLNAVASYTNSTDVIDHLKNKLQQHNKDLYEEWEKNDFYINQIFLFGTLLHFTVRSKSEDVVESVIKAGADVNLQDSREATPLHYAAKRGYARIVEILLKAGARVDVQDRKERTALHRAAAEGYSEVVEALIKAGASANIEDVYKKTPLYWAAENGCVRVVEVLLEAGANYGQDNMKRIPLHRAAAKGHSEVVVSLIKAGANANLNCFWGSTPLHHAAKNGSVRVVEALLKAGTKIDVQDNMKKTALHMAAEKKHSEIVEALIKAGANVDFQDNEKMTPLHRAAGNGCALVVKALLKAGAKIDVQNDIRNTALHMAVKGRRLEVVEELIKAGANVNLRCYDVHTPSQALESLGIDEESITDSFPLHYAGQNRCVRIVEVLLEAGAEVNAQTEAGDTALHAAVLSNHSEVVEILIKAGADVNIQNDEGETPLHHAAGEDCSWMVEALLKAGADPNIQDFDGRTPLHFLAREDYAPAVEALLKAGADVYIQDNEGEDTLQYPNVMRTLIFHEIPLKGSKEQKQSYLPLGYSSGKKHSQYWDDCLCEVKKMKEVKIDNDMTIYDFLRIKDINKLASHMRNKNRALMLETYNYEKEFPMYAKDLRRQVKIGKERLYYLDVATVILRNMEHVSALSNFFHIRLMIAEKFTNEDIEELKDVVIDILDEKKKANLLNTEIDLKNMSNAQKVGHDTLVKRKRLRRE